LFRKLIRSKPFLLTAPASFDADFRARVKGLSIREDDVWIVTYPKESSTNIREEGNENLKGLNEKNS
jgi:hypothetical protein